MKLRFLAMVLLIKIYTTVKKFGVNFCVLECIQLILFNDTCHSSVCINPQENKMHMIRLY